MSPAVGRWPPQVQSAEACEQLWGQGAEQPPQHLSRRLDLLLCDYGCRRVAPGLKPNPAARLIHQGLSPRGRITCLRELRGTLTPSPWALRLPRDVGRPEF